MICGRGNEQRSRTPQRMMPAGPGPSATTRANCLADCQQHCRVFYRFQAMPGVRHHEEISGSALPDCLSRCQPDAAAQNLDGRLARAFVLVEADASL